MGGGDLIPLYIINPFLYMCKRIATWLISSFDLIPPAVTASTSTSLPL